MSSNKKKPQELFKCTLCGDCCHGYGGTYVTADDIRAIADCIGVSPENFMRTYCRMSGSRPVLGQQDNGYCLFWDKVCTIHAVKPQMCRAWPFIESVLVDTNNWRSMASMCPGIRTDASDLDICRCVREKLSAKKGARR